MDYLQLDSLQCLYEMDITPQDMREILSLLVKQNLVVVGYNRNLLIQQLEIVKFKHQRDIQTLCQEIQNKLRAIREFIPQHKTLIFLPQPDLSIDNIQITLKRLQISPVKPDVEIVGTAVIYIVQADVQDLMRLIKIKQQPPRLQAMTSKAKSDRRITRGCKKNQPNKENKQIRVQKSQNSDDEISESESAYSVGQTSNISEDDDYQMNKKVKSGPRALKIEQAIQRKILKKRDIENQDMFMNQIHDIFNF